MARYSIRNTVILAGIQAAIGTELTTMTGAANAIQCKDVNITPIDATLLDQGLTLPWFGASPQLVGESSRKVEFTCMLAGTGVASGTGTAPAYDALLQACAFVGVGGATPTRYSYSLLSTNLKAATLYVYDDGILHKYVDAVGDVELSLGENDIPQLKFSFLARDAGDSAAANPTATLTAWKQPIAITSANSGNLSFGGSFATGAVTGATGYTSTGIQSLKLGNKTVFTPLLGGSAVDITDRDATGSIEMDLTPAQEVTFNTAVRNSTLQAMSLKVGNAAGASVLVWMPAVQLTNPKKIDKNGRRLIGYDFIACPSAGNDEVQLVLL